MTPREGEALTFITDYLRRRNGVSPTLAEVGAALDLSSRGAVHVLVASLERQGRIKREPGRRRNISLADPLAGFTIAELDAEIARREREWSAQCARVAACADCGEHAGSAKVRDCDAPLCPMRVREAA